MINGLFQAGSVLIHVISWVSWKLIGLALFVAGVMLAINEVEAISSGDFESSIGYVGFRLGMSPFFCAFLPFCIVMMGALVLISMPRRSV